MSAPKQKDTAGRGRALSGSAAVALIFVAGGCGGSTASPPAATKTGTAAVTPVAPPQQLPTAPPAPASYAPWPAAGHDARHSGSATGLGPQRGRVRWRRRLEGPVVPGPIVGLRGVVFAASNGGVLHALDPAAGRDRWRFDGRGQYGTDLTTSPLLLPGGRLLLWPGPHDTLYAVDAVTGAERWRLRFGAQVLSPALGSGGVVYVSDMGGDVRALRPTSAGPNARWRLTVGGTGYASPAVDRRDGATRIFVASDDDLVAVRDHGSRGSVEWRGRTGDAVEVSASVTATGAVAIGSNDKRLHAFGPGGMRRWQAKLESLTYSSSAAAADGTVLVGDHRGAVSRLSAGDGHVVARYVGVAQTPRQRSVGVWTAPATDARGDVYFGTRLGHVYGFTYGGRRLFDVRTGGTVDSNPAIGPNGTLYVGSEDGHLYAIG